MLEKLRGALRKLSHPSPNPPPPQTPAPAENPFSSLQWIEAGQSPFGVRVLDCRIVTRGMRSVTSDPNVAAKFSELRTSTGEQHRGSLPLESVPVTCDLAYPFSGGPRNGCLFVAQEMEDKWDIYLFDGYLYFARSWTGQLVFRARIDFSGEQAVISSIDVQSEIANADARFAIRQVDFLVKSHIYKREVPHPLPRDLADEPQAIAMYSFAQYGRWGGYATFADTTQVRLSA